MINEQSLKEEYQDRTVYKITKHRSPVRQEEREGGGATGGQNLSKHFDDISMDEEEEKVKVVSAPNQVKKPISKAQAQAAL
jgi:hypothetical protein